MEKGKLKEKISAFYNKRYKFLFLASALLIILALIYIFVFHAKTGDFIYRDISLAGGTSVTIYSSNLSVSQLQRDLPTYLGDIDVNSIKDIVTQQQKAVIIQTHENADQAKTTLERYLGYNLTEQNSSFEFTNPSIGTSFYQQLLIAILIAFVFMSIVVFILFRTFIPSLAVVLSAFADILMTLAVVDLSGMKLSSAGIIAFLMLIGYSVDTDILLTNRVLKSTGSGSVNSKIFGAFKTGITMTIAALVAVLSALLILSSFSNTMSQIFTILAIGLCFDVFNTWVTNAVIIKWYASKKYENKS
ncbi:MAG: protein translocase subunit SecF [Nanoarchaeota archaeon]|nr:protein translocase subunit SecF [Nanoarchaeota archaeon]